MTAELSADQVDVAYGNVTVVHGATVHLASGRVTALLGPNGSGKSTLLRAMARLQRPSAGSLTLDGSVPIHSFSARELARRITLLSQSRGVPGGVTVAEIVEYGRHPHRGRFGLRDHEGARIVARSMALTHVTDLADRPIDTLSGGQLQRVWLASCLAQDTGILLLDEPTTFLDLRHQVELLDIIRELADDHGIAVGVVLHDLDQAAAIADEVVLLVEGRVVAAGSVAEVFDSRTLSEAYGIPIDVAVDPDTGLLRTRAQARHHGRQRSDTRATDRPAGDRILTG